MKKTLDTFFEQHFNEWETLPLRILQSNEDYEAFRKKQNGAHNFLTETITATLKAVPKTVGGSDLVMVHMLFFLREKLMHLDSSFDNTGLPYNGLREDAPPSDLWDREWDDLRLRASKIRLLIRKYTSIEPDQKVTLMFDAPSQDMTKKYAHAKARFNRINSKNIERLTTELNDEETEIVWLSHIAITICGYLLHYIKRSEEINQRLMWESLEKDLNRAVVPLNQFVKSKEGSSELKSRVDYAVDFAEDIIKLKSTGNFLILKKIIEWATLFESVKDELLLVSTETLKNTHSGILREEVLFYDIHYLKKWVNQTFDPDAPQIYDGLLSEAAKKQQRTLSDDAKSSTENSTIFTGLTKIKETPPEQLTQELKVDALLTCLEELLLFIEKYLEATDEKLAEFSEKLGYDVKDRSVQLYVIDPYVKKTASRITASFKETKKEANKGFIHSLKLVFSNEEGSS